MKTNTTTSGTQRIYKPGDVVEITGDNPYWKGAILEVVKEWGDYGYEFILIKPNPNNNFYSTGSMVSGWRDGQLKLVSRKVPEEQQKITTCVCSYSLLLRGCTCGGL